MEKKWTILFIKDHRSDFDLQTPALSSLFSDIDFVEGKEETIKYFNAITYDIVIGDLSVEPEQAGLLKQLRDLKPKQAIFAMVSPKDADKLFGIADMNINAFELTPEHFDLALEQIAKFDPYFERPTPPGL